MSDNRECLIDGCNHIVPPQNEVDIGVGILCSSEPPICQDCHESSDQKVVEQINQIESDNKSKLDGTPF